MDEGHCGLPTDELVPLAEKLLEVPKELIRTALGLELTEGTVIADSVGQTPCVFLAGLYRAAPPFPLSRTLHTIRITSWERPHQSIALRPACP
jgi:hypothetical protein